MEKHFLDDFIKEIDSSAVKGSHKDQLGLWYNPYGDCIQFQTVQEAIVVDRVDEYLTIYKSAIDEDAVGFKIKDVHALIKKHGLTGVEVSATVTGGRKLLSVTALLLKAFSDSQPTITRVEGYTTAFNISKPVDEVEIGEPTLVG